MIWALCKILYSSTYGRGLESGEWWMPEAEAVKGRRKRSDDSMRDLAFVEESESQLWTIQLYTGHTDGTVFAKPSKWRNFLCEYLHPSSSAHICEGVVISELPNGFQGGLATNYSRTADNDLALGNSIVFRFVKRSIFQPDFHTAQWHTKVAATARIMLLSPVIVIVRLSYRSCHLGSSESINHPSASENSEIGQVLGRYSWRSTMHALRDVYKPQFPWCGADGFCGKQVVQHRLSRHTTLCEGLLLCVVAYLLKDASHF